MKSDITKDESDIFKWEENILCMIWGNLREVNVYKNIKYQNQQNVEKLNYPVTIEIVPKEQLPLERDRFVNEV